MTYRDDVMEGLVRVVAEHEAARKAVTFLLSSADVNPTLLVAGTTTFAGLRACLKNLERTYLVRLFALFEGTLRDIWLKSFKKKNQPKTSLLDGCAAKRKFLPDRLRSDVHEVREYRNAVVHGHRQSSSLWRTRRVGFARFLVGCLKAGNRTSTGRSRLTPPTSKAW